MSGEKFKVVVFNPGSASLKFEIIEGEPPRSNVVRGRKLVRGVVEPIGGRSNLIVLNGQKPELQEELEVRDHGQAAEKVLSYPARANSPGPQLCNFLRVSPVEPQVQMRHISIQVTVDIYGQLIPGTDVEFLDKPDSAIPPQEPQGIRRIQASAWE